MKRLLIAGLALALLVPACALAHSAFNGTWKLDPSTLHVTGGTGHVQSLKNGVYECSKGCGPSTIKVKADGTDHAVTGNPDYDTVAIEVISDHSIRETDKKDGKIVSTSTATVAADGKTGTVEFTDNSGPKPASGTFVVERAGNAMPGESALTGTWKFGHYKSLSDPSDTVVLNVVGNRITAGNEAGSSSYTAEIGGKAVPFTHNGKPDGTVSVKRAGKDSLRATYEKDGTVTRTVTVTVAANGKTMKMITHNPHTGATATMIHDKV
jgi:hypothetical protein